MTHMDLIARMLEAAGYAVEVEYTSAVIIVWLDEWPVVIQVKRRPERDGRTIHPVSAPWGQPEFRQLV